MENQVPKSNGNFITMLQNVASVYSSVFDLFLLITNILEITFFMFPHNTDQNNQNKALTKMSFWINQA